MKLAEQVLLEVVSAGVNMLTHLCQELFGNEEEAGVIQIPTEKEVSVVITLEDDRE